MTEDKEHSNSIRCQLAIINLARQVCENYTNKEYDVMEKLAKDGFKMEHLWEIIIEELANTKCLGIGATGADFEDGSDAKIITFRKVREQTTSFRGDLKNLKNKKGHLRVAVFNLCYDRFDFFLIPPDHHLKLSAKNFKIADAFEFSYNRKTDRYTRGLETYRVADVYEVCQPVNRIIKTEPTLDDYMKMEAA